MSSEVIIDIEHVTKEYRLGAIGGGTLKGDLQSLSARIRGKEDPNAKIGQDVYVKNQKFLALNDVNFKVYKGERLGIIGHNGAGKSTLLKLLSRVTAPTSGRISYNGRIASMLEVGTGFHPELTGRENVYMNGAILGMTKAEIDRKFDDIVAFAEMEKFINTPVKRYSSGMYVKLAFAVAAHLDSEIMVMDEVLAVGDMKFQQKCLGKMGEASESEGRTILYVSHNMSTIRQLCTRCIVLDHGTVVFDGDVERAIEIYMAYNTTDKPYIDFSNISRSSWLQDTYVRTQYMCYVGKDDINFSVGEDQIILLRWLNEKDVTNLCLRIEVLERDRRPIGTAMLYDFYSGSAGEKGECTVRLSTPGLVPGKYTMTCTFFLKNEFGANMDVDCVHGLYFEISTQKMEIMWHSSAWGNIEFPQLVLQNGLQTEG